MPTTTTLGSRAHVKSAHSAALLANLLTDYFQTYAMYMTKTFLDLRKYKIDALELVDAVAAALCSWISEPRGRQRQHQINIVEKSSGKKLLSSGNSSDAFQDEMTIKEVISVYSNHPSIRKIKNACVPENKCDLLYASSSSINRIIKSLNVNKSKGPDGISAKLIKMPANIIDCYLANIINNDVSLNIYSKHAKTATGRSIFKKGDSLLRCKSFEYFFENIQTISA